jgi:RNA 3'-terminal phosphate cyclase (ATP)
LTVHPAAGFWPVDLSERGELMEKVAREACKAFMAWWKSGAAVDENLADQLVLPMALAAGQKPLDHAGGHRAP